MQNDKVFNEFYEFVGNILGKILTSLDKSVEETVILEHMATVFIEMNGMPDLDDQIQRDQVMDIIVTPRPESNAREVPFDETARSARSQNPENP